MPFIEMVGEGRGTSPLRGESEGQRRGPWGPGACVSSPGSGRPPPPRGWRRSGSGCRTPGAHLSGRGWPGRAEPPDERTAKCLPRPFLAVLLCVGAAQLWEVLCCSSRCFALLSP